VLCCGELQVSLIHEMLKLLSLTASVHVIFKIIHVYEPPKMRNTECKKEKYNLNTIGLYLKFNLKSRAVYLLFQTNFGTGLACDITVL